MQVYLSPLAEKKIQLLLEYLEQEWSVRSKEDFLLKLIKKFNLISRHPQSGIQSREFPNLYKCIVTPQTSFYYRVILNEIEVITLIDNRQDPKKTLEDILKSLG
jgi:plasmid stabilization system protein ParE